MQLKKMGVVRADTGRLAITALRTATKRTWLSTKLVRAPLDLDLLGTTVCQIGDFFQRCALRPRQSQGRLTSHGCMEPSLVGGVQISFETRSGSLIRRTEIVFLQPSR